MFKPGQFVKINPKILSIPLHLSHICPPARYRCLTPKTFRLKSVQKMYINELGVYNMIKTDPNYEWFKSNFPQLNHLKEYMNVWEMEELGEKVHGHTFVEWILIPIDNISIY